MKTSTVYNKYKIFVILTTVLTIFLSLISDITGGYQYIVLIPLVYGILFILNNPMHSISKNYNGMIILNVILYIKYIVTTFFVIVNKDYSNPVYTGTVPSSESCSFAIFYIIVEMIFVFLTIYVFGYKFYEKNLNEEEYNKKFEKINMNIILIIFIVLVSIIAMANLKQFIPTPFLSKNTNVLNQEETNRNISITFFYFENNYNGIDYKLLNS